MDYFTIGKINEKQTSTEFIIKDLIDNHDTVKMVQGVNYYNNDNIIKKRQLYFWKDGIKQIDETKINNRIPHNWHKLLVDQKVSYLVGTPMVINSTSGQDARDEEYNNLITEYTGEDWDDVVNELVKHAANKGVEWLQPYINEEGEFKFINIPGEQCIPIYDTSRQENLEIMLRYYTIDYNGNSRIRAEWWTSEDVTYYIEGENGQFEVETINVEGQRIEKKEGHFTVTNTTTGLIQWQSWGRVPFIAFKNNSECVSDLKFYKELIDLFDIVNSDMANDLEEIQKIITVLKGYAGTNLNEFMNDLRYFKVVKVDDTGGVEKLEQSIPIEAWKEFKEGLKEAIYTFGQGVNVSTDKFGNSPSGVALKFIYSLLDMKCSIMERKLRKAIKEFLWFVTEYINIKYKKDFDYKDIQVTFRKTMITNDAEDVEMAQKSKGIISDKTIIANHPWVEVVQDELRELENQNTINLDDVEDDEDDTDPEI